MNRYIKFPFPGWVLTSKEQFLDHQSAHSILNDYRFGLEQSLASTKDVVLNGICPLSLTRTTFTSPIMGGEALKNGKIVPNWSDGQLCNKGIGMADRATLHYAAYNADNEGLKRTLILPNTQAVVPFAHAFSDQVDVGVADTIDTLKQAYDTIVVSSALQGIEDIDQTLTALKQNLNPGGSLYFSVNLHYLEDVSVRSATQTGYYWAYGWDLLQRLSESGFYTPQAVGFWSFELGYLGPIKFVFAAKA